MYVLALTALVLGALTAPLRVGSDISYAPVEFYAPHTHQVAGFDYDLAQELAKHLGTTVSFTNHDFNTIVPALKAGQFDLIMSAMSDNREREKQVDFIDYFLAGSGILVAKGNPMHIYGVGDLCGRTVDLQLGSSQEKMVKAQSQTCTALHLGPVTILAYKTDDEAFKQIVAGKSAAHISDFPVVAYIAKTYGSGKRFDVVGKQFGVVPYGIAVSKQNRALRDGVQSALERMVADGSYDRILKKWGLEQGALRSAPISAGTLFQ
ncbi:MAG: ABC transporter substrate-binding protein [Vulcanimicrobiaceae bacterium]